MLTARLLLTARKDRDIVSAASDDFDVFRLCDDGISLGTHGTPFHLIKNQKTAEEQPKEFYIAKTQTAEFYFEKFYHVVRPHAESRP